MTWNHEVYLELVMPYPCIVILPHFSGPKQPRKSRDSKV